MAFARLRLSARPFWVGFFLQIALFGILGGSLQTPDSLVYLNLAQHPLSHSGSWHPLGFPLFLFPFARSPYLIWVGLSLLAGLFSSLIWRLQCSRAIWLFCLIEPTWLMLRSSVWSETLFATTAVGIALALNSRFPRWLKTLAVLCLCLYLTLTRHAGLFLLPAALIGLALAWKPRPFERKHLPFAVGFSLVGVVLLAILAVTRPPRSDQSAISKMACTQGIMALTPLGLCENDLTPRLCELDPQREWLTGPRVASVYEDAALFFDPKSPFAQYQQRYRSDEICMEYRSALKRSLIEVPLPLLGLWAGRVAQSLGAWRMTERGAPSPHGHPAAERALDCALRVWNWFQPLYFALAIALIGIGCAALGRRGRLSPATVFFLLAAAGHAAGIAINNPFPSLRYMAIAKLFLVLALGTWLNADGGKDLLCRLKRPRSLQG